MRDFSRFESIADTYDRNWRHIVPSYDEVHRVLVEVLGFTTTKRDARILDLGCGTGEIGRRCLSVLSDARWTLIDGAPGMLRRAQAILLGRVERAVTGDFADDEIWDGLEGFDAIVSTFAVHHLRDEEKMTLYARAAAALKPGGILLIGDLVRVRGDAEAGLYTAWVRATVERNLGDGLLDPAFWERERRLPEDAHLPDYPAEVTDHLAWIAGQGLVPFRVWQHLGIALYGGRAKEAG